MVLRLTLTNNGQATFMGVVTNFPGLSLENAGSEMYGVGIQINSASSLVQSLVGIDLNSLVPGGTNLDGSTVNINYELLTDNFPNNYNFSSANLYVVPEPGGVLICLTGGLIFQVITMGRKRRSSSSSVCV